MAASTALLFVYLAYAAIIVISAVPIPDTTLPNGQANKQMEEENQQIVKRGVQSANIDAISTNQLISLSSLLDGIENGIFQTASSATHVHNNATAHLPEIKPASSPAKPTDEHLVAKRQNEGTHVASPNVVVLQTTERVPRLEGIPAHILIDRISVQPFIDGGLPQIPVFQVQHLKPIAEGVDSKVHMTGIAGTALENITPPATSTPSHVESIITPAATVTPSTSTVSITTALAGVIAQTVDPAVSHPTREHLQSDNIAATVIQVASTAPSTKETPKDLTVAETIASTTPRMESTTSLVIAAHTDSSKPSSSESPKVQPTDSAKVPPTDSAKVPPTDSAKVAETDSLKAPHTDSSTIPPTDSSKTPQTDSSPASTTDSSKASTADFSKVIPTPTTTATPTTTTTTEATTTTSKPVQDLKAAELELKEKVAEIEAEPVILSSRV